MRVSRAPFGDQHPPRYFRVSMEPNWTIVEHEMFLLSILILKVRPELGIGERRDEHPPVPRCSGMEPLLSHAQ